MAAAAVTCRAFLEARPGISVIDLATEAVADHIEKNGCAFEDNAPARAVELLGIDPHSVATALPPEILKRLEDALEDMETYCPHRTLGQVA